MTIPLAQRFDVLKRDNFRCRYCGKRAPETELEVDHVQPRSAEGSDDMENLVTACRDCNRGKRDRPISPPGFWAGLEGKWFHTWCKGGCVHQQGQIEECLGNGIYVVQFYRWLVGDPAWSKKLVRLDQIIDEHWALYESSEQMRDAYQYAGIAHQEGSHCECEDKEASIAPA